MYAIALLATVATATPAQPQTIFVADGLGKGTIPLDGPWQFHLGDDMAWANPGFDDSKWEQIDVSKPWGDQGHWGYAGFAWYRRQIDIKDEPDGAVDVALFVPLASSSYEVYWNGHPVGSTDRMPKPPLIFPTQSQMFRLGGPSSGLLAFRVLSPLPDSTLYGNQFGLAAVPRVGNSEAIANLQASTRASVFRSNLLDVAQMAIYAQLFLVGLLVWIQNRSQKLLFWMTAFFFSAELWILFQSVLFPWLSHSFIGQLSGNPLHSLEDVALWFLLLYLLNLDRYSWLIRLARILACIALACGFLDDLLFWPDWSNAHIWIFRTLDAVLTAGFAVPQIFPLILIPFAFSKRLDPARRLVAVAAFLSDMYFVVWHTAIQGQLFTRWTLGDTMQLPMFYVEGIAVTMPDILSMMLICTIVYAVYHYMVEQGQRQTALQQELQNARELQQVLIPESLPGIPGFTLTSAYKPAQEVGGDFFQIIPLDGSYAGSTLIVLGDVSGKGLRAAMAVSLLVGAIRSTAETTSSPAAILATLNRRLHGRLQGGFATCIALLIFPDGRCAFASAGHPAPYVNGREAAVPGALPLGIDLSASYDENHFQLQPDDRLALCTDGLLEARNSSGELYGFDRLRALFAANPTADQAAEAAVQFGQDDDITVLTLTRLADGEASTLEYAAPVLSPA
jgi:serine phosphatase RsbU (regulator of sigma subunit)